MTQAVALHSGMDETQAAQVEETESIHAWSLADDTPTVIDYRPKRSWRLPVIAGITAAAALTTGVVMWPRHHTDRTPAPTISATKPQENATKPQVTPSPLVEQQSQVQRLIALVHQRDPRLSIVSPTMAEKAARTVCERSAAGESDSGIAQSVAHGTPGFDLSMATVFIDTAHEVYCP